MMAAGFLPLIMDLFKGGAAPDKGAIDQVVAMRDSKVQQLVGSGVKQADAEAQVNAEIEPLLAQLHKNDGPSGLELLGDAAVGLAGVGAARRLLPKKASAKIGDADRNHGAIPANAPTAEPGKPTQSLASDKGDFKSPARSAAEQGSMDRVEGAKQGGFGGFLEGPTRQGVMVPPNGGADPFDEDELLRLMMAAKTRRMPQRPPPAFRSAPLGIESGRTIDLQRLGGNTYGAEGG
jgi:hypothetical protein